MVFEIILALFLVFLNGFFVAAEFAIVKVRSSQISLQRGTPSKTAAKVIIENLDGFLAATQLGITLASLGLGWVGEDVVSEIILAFMHGLGVSLSEAVAHRIALPTAFVIITILHIVFGELAPKSIAIRYPTTTTLTVSVPLRIFYFIFKPFIAVLNGFANFLLRLLGIKPIDEKEIHTEEELKLIIAESVEGGAIEASERELIQNVFDFDDRTVKQIMVPRVKISSMSAETQIEDALRPCFKEGYSRYPVYGNDPDDIVGIVHAKDIAKSHFDNPGRTLRDIKRSAYFIPDNKRIDHLLREFQKLKTQMAIVLNEYGGLVGLVTLEDILEELVGEIQDEHDHEVQVVTKQGDAFRVVATTSLHDINKFLKTPIDESGDYETLAGLILTEHPGPLHEGDELRVGNYAAKIVQLKRHLPEIVDLRLVPDTETD
ncbi:MAG: hemolysin family protein [Cyclobacteriaceae bacterium]